jgi:hypothetical protein
VAGADEDLAVAALHGGLVLAHHLRMVPDQSLRHLRFTSDDALQQRDAA